MNFQTRVTMWAEDPSRDLVNGSSPSRQIEKLREEVEELQDAIDDGDRDATMDAIGDIQVVLAVMCCQLSLNIDNCRDHAWEEIKNRKGRNVDGVFVKE